MELDSLFGIVLSKTLGFLADEDRVAIGFSRGLCGLERAPELDCRRQS